MATVQQLPGRLDLAFRRGDDFGTLVDFSVSLAGHTFAAVIVSAVTGATVATPTVTAVDLSAGQLNVSLTDVQTSSLAAGTYKWRLTWTSGSTTRTALEGYVEVAP